MKNVLLIDDDVNFTTGVKVNLEDTGDYVVDVINDSSLAVPRARENRPDIILLDIVMPGLDGGDVVKMFESDPDLRDIPILVITAMIHSETAGSDLVETGDFSMLAKPIKSETLIGSIEKTLAPENSGEEN